jgi:hypothetical protein
MSQYALCFDRVSAAWLARKAVLFASVTQFAQT